MPKIFIVHARLIHKRFKGILSTLRTTKGINGRGRSNIFKAMGFGSLN